MAGTKKKSFRLQVVLPKILNIASLVSLFVVLGVLSYRYYSLSLVYMNLQEANDKLLDEFDSCSAKRIEAQEKADRSQEEVKDLTFQIGDVKNKAYQAETENKVATDDLNSKLEETSGKLDDCIEDNAIFEEEIISMQDNLTELREENDHLMDDKADLRKQIDMLTTLLSKDSSAQSHSLRSQNDLPIQPTANFDKFPPLSESTVIQDHQTIGKSFDTHVDNQQAQQRDQGGSQEQQQQLAQMQNNLPNFYQQMFRHGSVHNSDVSQQQGFAPDQGLLDQRLHFSEQPIGQSNPSQNQGANYLNQRGAAVNQQFNNIQLQQDQGRGYVNGAPPSTELQGQNIGYDFNSQQLPNQVSMQQTGSLTAPQQQPPVAPMNRGPMEQPPLAHMNRGPMEQQMMSPMNGGPNERFNGDIGNQGGDGTTTSSTESTGSDLDEENESVEIKVGKYAMPGQS